MKCLPSKVMEVPVHLVQFADYQRPVDMKKVEAIMREFNPRRVRPIELSYRDGVYYCFDGQHRLRAYQRLGQTKIEAQVHFGLTYKEEAKLFADQHRNEKHISKRDEWRARVLAGNADAGASAVSETLRVYGYTMDICPQTGLTPVGAINEIQKLYDETGLPGLNSALAIATGAWGNTQRPCTAKSCLDCARSSSPTRCKSRRSSASSKSCLHSHRMRFSKSLQRCSVVEASEPHAAWSIIIIGICAIRVVSG